MGMRHGHQCSKGAWLARRAPKGSRMVGWQLLRLVSSARLGHSLPGSGGRAGCKVGQLTAGVHVAHGMDQKGESAVQTCCARPPPHTHVVPGPAALACCCTPGLMRLVQQEGATAVGVAPCCPALPPRLPCCAEVQPPQAPPAWPAAGLRGPAAATWPGQCEQQQCRRACKRACGGRAQYPLARSSKPCAQAPPRTAPQRRRSRQAWTRAGGGWGQAFSFTHTHVHGVGHGVGALLQRSQVMVVLADEVGQRLRSK
jgi:hypothetical protein